MRLALSLSLLAWMLATTGCALFEDGTRNVWHCFADPVEECRERHRDRDWADIALAEFVAADKAGPRSADFAKGFKDGYTEYLYLGGSGEPPLMPPPHYRKLHYQTPEGYRAITDWYEGFRHGAAYAKESGAREWITGPSSLRAMPPHVPPPVAPLLGADVREGPPVPPPEVVPQPLPPPLVIPQPLSRKSSQEPTSIPQSAGPTAMPDETRPPDPVGVQFGLPRGASFSDLPPH